MEKVLIECCLELYAARVVEGIQDLGAAGISCATSELASNGDGGMHVDLENVLLRDPTLTAGEILMSESQERMMAVVRPDQLDEFLAITAKWDVETAVIGEVTGTGRLTIDHHGERIVDVEPRSVAHDGPVYDRPYARPAWQDGLNADTAASLQKPADERRAPRDRPAAAGLARTWRPRPGSPASTTGSCRATPRSRSPTTRASSASTRPPAWASRWPPTPTAATPSSTRTPARSWPSRRRTATSRRPAPARWP